MFISCQSLEEIKKELFKGLGMVGVTMSDREQWGGDVTYYDAVGDKVVADMYHAAISRHFELQTNKGECYG